LPMQSMPVEMGVGSQALFNNLLNGTVPTFGFSTSFEQCGSNSDGFSCGFPAASSGESAGSAYRGGGDGGAGPSIVLHQAVGAFDITGLRGGTAQEVSDWLNANGYQSAVTAPSILQDYVSKGYVFLAIKLTGGTGIDEIHPLVVRYAGNTPCVPLKLTSVAAVPDMGVRTFFLGSERVVPSNYKHVTLNQARIDWAAYGNNYNQVVSRAVDSPVSDGRGFVTEYAGPSNVVSAQGVYDPAWNPSKFQNIAPELVVKELGIQKLVQCSYYTCQYLHPLVKPLLEEFLPRPAGLTEDEFYSNLASYKGQIDMAVWNAASFAARLDELIVQPGLHATLLLEQNPYLTRLFTTISPEEMTIDPEFRRRPGLPDVPRLTQATQRVLCNGGSIFTLPNAQVVALDNQTASWPKFSDDELWAETIEDVPATGDPIVLVDNTKKIQDQVDASNARNNWPPETAGCECGLPSTRSQSLVGVLGLAGAAMLWSRRRARP
ncbi:MAG TPA: DUF2330 domain-containing protein, partial [Polyangiaceae bacterium]